MTLVRMLLSSMPRVPAMLIAVMLLAAASESRAMPVVCEPPACATWSSGTNATGNKYSFIALDYTTTWSEASALAQASTLSDGSVGQLASIGSQEEQDFIRNAVLPPSYVGVNKNQVWIGGRQDDGASSPSESWKWIVNASITPESWSYENWTSPGEPNDEGGINERFLTMWVHYYQNAQDWRGTWNDELDLANPAARIIGMIVEWTQPSVPEPGAAALVALGLGLLTLRRRTR